MKPTRGILNCNPGNIRHGDKWLGLSKEQPDKDFCSFTSPEYGIRAMCVILNNYEKRGINTIRKVISTWAPPSENDTEAYIKAVSTDCGVVPDFPLQPKDRLHLVEGIIYHENGYQPYSPEVIAKGIAMALK